MTEHFDNRIREQLADYTPEVPSHIWENIAKRKKKRRGAFWFWLSKNKNPMLIAGFLLIAGLIITDLAIEKKSGSSSRLMSSAKDVEGNNDINAGHSDSGSGQESTKTVVESENNLIKSPEEELTEFSKQNTAKKEINHPAHHNNTEEQDLENSSSVELNSTAKNLKKSMAISARTETYITAASPETSRKRNLKKTRSFRIDHEAEQKTQYVTNSATQSNEPPAALESKESYSRTSENFSFMMRKTPVAWIPQPKGIATGTIPCPENIAAANKKYLEFYIGPDHTIRTYRDTGNSEYLRKRKESASNAFAFSAGARFTKVFNNAMSVRAGVNYSLITEKFEVVEGNVIKVIYILDNNNDTIGNYSTRVNIYRTTYNKYHSIDIPVAIGYEFGNGNLHGNLNAGVIANIYSWQKGATLDGSYKSVSITTGEPASPYQFKTNMGISFAGAVSLYYRFENRIQLMAEPYFRYSLSPANKEEITLRQKFHTVGLRLGIRYDLNKIIE